MKPLRRFLADKLLAWPTFGLVAYLLVFQGLVGNYAQAATVLRDISGWSVICTHLGLADGTDADSQDPLVHDCCVIACQMGGGKLIGGANAAPFVASGFIAVAIERDLAGEGACPTTRLASLPEARAPPVHS